MRLYGRMILLTAGISLLATGMISASLAASAELKVGSIDIRRAVNECNEGREAKRALAGEVQDYQRLSAEKQKGLQDMRDALQKQDVMLAPEARATKERELETKIKEFQRWTEDRENEIKQKQADIETRISIGLQKVIQKLGEDEGYSLILDKNDNIVFFTSTAIDITDRVIKVYDARNK